MKLLYIVAFSSMFSALAYRPSAVTFYAGGRLGDKLMVYVKAKWFAYKYDLPFYCSEFEFMDSFKLAKQDARLKKGEEKNWKHKKVVKVEADIDLAAQETLFVVDFYVKSPDTAHVVDIKNRFLENPSFYQDICASIAPCDPVTPLTASVDCATVAVHVRRGSAGDLPLLTDSKESGGKQNKKSTTRSAQYSDVNWPTKFPPDDYYIKQIRRLNEMLGNQPLYVYIFTDYAFPQEIVAKYADALQLPNITFDYRRDHNYKSNIIEDLFALSQFDYLIRSISSYSGIAFLFGNHKKVLAPARAEWRDDKLIIDKVLLSTLQEDHSYLREELVN